MLIEVHCRACGQTSFPNLDWWADRDGCPMCGNLDISWHNDETNDPPDGKEEKSEEPEPSE